jgi:hypothetical protein
VPILRILCLKIGQRRPEDEMSKWGSYFSLVPYSLLPTTHSLSPVMRKYLSETQGVFPCTEQVFVDHSHSFLIVS